MPEELQPDYSLCPRCPEIKRKIDRIDLALLGEDGTGSELGKFCKNHRHWCGHVDCDFSINFQSINRNQNHQIAP